MSHHVLGTSGRGNVEEAILADVALRRVPAHLEGAGGGISDLQILHSAQSLCRQRASTWLSISCLSYSHSQKSDKQLHITLSSTLSEQLGEVYRFREVQQVCCQVSITGKWHLLTFFDYLNFLLLPSHQMILLVLYYASKHHIYNIKINLRKGCFTFLW